MKATTLLCLSAPQLHRTVLPPSTHDKIFWCCGAFFFSRDLRPGKRFAILHTHLDNRISRPDWIQRHDLAELRASLTTPLQNRGRNLIRGERRTTTDTSIHIHTPMPGFESRECKCESRCLLLVWSPFSPDQVPAPVLQRRCQGCLYLSKGVTVCYTHFSAGPAVSNPDG